jgi:hypothetical protein
MFVVAGLARQRSLWAGSPGTERPPETIEVAMISRYRSFENDPG